jgi:hypothetical protein
VAGAVNGGQILTPSPNTNAGQPMAPVFVNGVRQSTFNISNPVAGLGGDKWGAYGGGITPITPPGTPIKQSLSNGQSPADYQVAGQGNLPVLGCLSNGSIPGRTLDTTADNTTTDTITADQQSPGYADSQI